MNSLANQKVFEVECRDAAKRALDGLSDKQKVHFALALILETKDPDTFGALRFAGNKIAELCNILIREAFEQECQ